MQMDQNHPTPRPAGLTIKITPNDKGNPPGKLADVELHFQAPTAGAGILSDVQAITYGPNQHEAKTLQQAAQLLEALGGLKLIGFVIWERRGGSGRTVTFPARQYAINGERRSFALLRPIVDTTAQNRLREAILAAYEEYEHLANAEPVGPTTAFARELADAIKAAPPVAELPYALTPTAAESSAVQLPLTEK
jgi:hypothetical protein